MFNIIVIFAIVFFLLYINKESGRVFNKTKDEIVREDGPGQQDTQKMLSHLKKKIIQEVNKDNHKKATELVKLWSKKLKELEKESTDTTKTIGYKLGNSLGSLVSGFKAGLKTEKEA